MWKHNRSIFTSRQCTAKNIFQFFFLLSSLHLSVSPSTQLSSFLWLSLSSYYHILRNAYSHRWPQSFYYSLLLSFYIVTLNFKFVCVLANKIFIYSWIFSKDKQIFVLHPFVIPSFHWPIILQLFLLHYCSLFPIIAFILFMHYFALSFPFYFFFFFFFVG